MCDLPQMLFAKKGLQRLTLGALIFCGQSSLFFNPTKAFADDPPEVVAKKSIWKSAAQVAGYIIPITPLMRSLKDKDRRFYMLVETPALGLITDPLAAYLVTHMAGLPITWPEMVQNYFSYQGSQVVRNGVTLDKSLSPNQKVVINWWITTLIYGALNGIPKIVEAAKTGDPHAMTFALSTLGFAAIWPILTQNINTRFIVPMFFSSYPNATQLQQIYDVENFPTEKLVGEKHDQIEKITSQAKTEGRELTKAELKSIKQINKNIYWIRWFRREKTPGAGENPKAKKSLYWLRKTGTVFLVATTMISAYYTTRYYVRGSSADPENWGPLTKEIQVITDYFGKEKGVIIPPKEMEDFTKTVVQQAAEQGPPPATTVEEAKELYGPPVRAMDNGTEWKEPFRPQPDDADIPRKSSRTPCLDRLRLH